MRLSDFQRIYKEKIEHPLLEDLLKEKKILITPPEMVLCIKILRNVNMLLKSVEVSFTESSKKYYVRAITETVVAVNQILACIRAPEKDGLYTTKQLSAAIRCTEQELLVDMLLHNSSLCEFFVLNPPHMYLDGGYGKLCIRNHFEYTDLGKIFQEHGKGEIAVFVDRIQNQFICGRFEQYYFGCNYEWYCRRNDSNAIKKELQTSKEEVTIHNAYVMHEGKCYILASKYMQNSEKFVSQSALSDWKDFLEKNETILGLLIKERECYLPEELSEQASKLICAYGLVYGTSEEERGRLLLGLLRPFPAICEGVQAVKSDFRESTINSVMLNLYVYVDKDIPNMSVEESGELIRLFNELPLVDCRLFEKMMDYITIHFECKTSTIPVFRERARGSLTKISYTEEQFSVLAYCLFNPEYYQSQDLIRKACEDSRVSEAWLFMALHFICAMRPSDLQRLPILPLEIEPATVVEGIRRGELTDVVCVGAIEKLEFHLMCNPFTPQKTSKYSNIPNVKIFFPQSLKGFFGKLYLLVSAQRILEHREDKLLFRTLSMPALKEFGELLYHCLEEKRFSSTAANKAFLQGIQATVDEDAEMKIEGYIIASLARSHKSSYAKIAKITDTYLKDAVFTSNTPEFYAKIMLDRGVLSFIPYLLCQYLMGESFTKLDLHMQTKIMKEVDLQPNEIETLMIGCQTALQQAREDVINLVQDQSKQSIKRGLQAIAAGQAVSKGLNSYCLRAALNQTCNYRSCMECPYELQTKADVYTLVTQYERVVSKYKQAESSIEKKKYSQILKILIPKVSEMVTYLRQQESEGMLFQWVKEVLNRC